MNDLAQHEAFVTCCLRQPRQRARFPQPRAPLTPTELSGLGYEGTVSKIGQTEMKVGGVVASIPGGQLVGGLIMLGGFIHTLMGKLFGPDPKNVPAAQAEQVFEIAADNAMALAKAGMVTVADAVGAEQQFLSMGTSYIQDLKLGTPGQQAIANMTKVINAEIAGTQKLPSKITQPLDLAKARKLYIGGSGWYPASVQGGAQLTDQWLQSISGGTASGAAGAAVSTMDIGSLFSNPLVLAALGIGGYLLFAGGGE